MIEIVIHVAMKNLFDFVMIKIAIWDFLYAPKLVLHLDLPNANG